MLEKIEAAYLAVMRVVVLIAATIALIICVVGASQAAPVVLRQLGWTVETPTEPPGLSDFIAERKLTQAPGQEVPVPEAAPIGETTLGQAARLINAYVATRSREELDPDVLNRALGEQQETLDLEHQGAYADSVLALARELTASKGRPLSLERVADLLTWHHSRFAAHVQDMKLAEMTTATKAQAGLGLAMGGLVAFILILFFFLFVKIERNLRLVRTRETPAP